MDFVHDQLLDAAKVRVLPVVHAFTRFSPALEARYTWRSSSVVDMLERVWGEQGFLRTIRVDQGPKFISKDLDLWAYPRGILLNFSRPGKPTENAFIESLNGKFRGKCLNAHWFLTLDDARSKMEERRRYYNEERPHSGIGQMTPILLHKLVGVSSPSTPQVAGYSNLGCFSIRQRSITDNFSAHHGSDSREPVTQGRLDPGPNAQCQIVFAYSTLRDPQLRTTKLVCRR